MLSVTGLLRSKGLECHSHECTMKAKDNLYQKQVREKTLKEILGILR